MELVTYLGITAAVLTTSAGLPQAIKTWKLKKADDISLRMYLLLCTGIVFWLVYGLLIRDIPIIMANTLSLGIYSTILGLKLKYM